MNLAPLTEDAIQGRLRNHWYNFHWGTDAHKQREWNQGWFESVTADAQVQERIQFWTTLYGSGRIGNRMTNKRTHKEGS